MIYYRIIQKMIGFLKKPTKSAMKMSEMKYIFEDYQEYPRLNWEELSTGLQEKYKKDKDSEGNEVCYASFYTKTVQELEDEVAKKIHDAYTKLNVVVRALG